MNGKLSSMKTGLVFCTGTNIIVQLQTQKEAFCH